MTTTTTAVEKKLKDIDSDVLSLSQKLAAKITMDNKTGAGTVEGDTFSENLPEGLTPAIVTALNDYRTTYVAAGAHAFGGHSLTLLGDNPTLNETNVALPYGDKDLVRISVDRTYQNNLSGSLDYGHMTIKTVHHAGKSSAGQLGLVRKHIGAAAIAALKKD